MTNLLDQLNKAKQDVHLSASRKAAIKEALIGQMSQMPQQHVTFFSFFTSRTFVVSALVLLVVLSGAATASASEVALPGDVLYPVKTQVMEKVKGAFVRSDAARAELALVQLDRRMDEGIELASNGSLDVEAEAKLNELMLKHAEQLKNQLDKLSEHANEEAVAEITARYEAILAVHNQALNQLDNNSKLNDTLKVQTAKAAEVREELESKASSGDQPQVAAENKINAAANVIAEVQNYIDKKSASGRVSAESKTSAQAKLQSAQALLNQAKTKSSAGNFKEVFNLANQSIRTAQEAKALVRLNYNLKVDVNLSANSNANVNLQPKQNNSGKSNSSGGSFPQRLKERWSDGLHLEFRD